MSQVMDSFRAAVAKSPEAIAVADREKEICYAELDRLSDLLASRLLSLGVRKEVFAAVYVTRTSDILLGELSVLKTGGAFTPIDAAYPEERVAFIVEEARCPVILTEHALWEKKPLPGYGGTVIYLDDAPSFPEVAALPVPEEEDNAFLLYTSGTTGTPKGVLHTHGSLMAAVRTALALNDPIREDSRVAVFAGFTFIASVLFLFAPVLSGGCAYIVDEETKQNLDALYRCFRRNRITHTFLPPSLGTVMAEQYDLRGIRLFFAGEKLHPFHSVYPLDAVNLYGSTEGVIVAYYELRGGEEDIPLGAASDGIEIRILGPDGTPVPDGETGELLYSGAISAKEYRNLPEQSAEKWTLLDGLRFFHTGDRVRLDENGQLLYVGRMDDMVKLHGYRVELGEVENRITACGLSPCACAVRKIRGADVLCCFYEEGKTADPARAEEEIRKSLPSYMIPERWIALPELPRNANGKITRRLLPKPEAERKPYVAPSNTVDEIIVKNIEKLLKVTRIGMEDCFTALGGDSVRAMTLSSELKQRGIILASSDILQAKSIRSLCETARVCYEEIWSKEERDELRRRYEAEGVHIEKVIPLSKENEVLLMDHILHPDNPDLVKDYSFLLDCCPDEPALRSVLDRLSEQFERLRVSVVYQGVSTIQMVLTDRRIPLSTATAETLEEKTECVQTFWRENGPFTFDLQNTSNIRFGCIRTGAGSSLILVAVYRKLAESAAMRRILCRFFEELRQRYPSSSELEGWVDLLSLTAEDGEEEISEEADGAYFEKMLSRSVNGHESVRVPEHPIFTYSHVEGSRPYLFVHTANTGSEAYYNLARRIGDRYSFAVLEQYNIYHPDSAVYGIKNIAAKYLEFVKEYQPEGPYYLGGWCYGGMIAYEMACLLEQAGEEVGLLVMLDSQTAVTENMKPVARANHQSVGRDYFENCPLFADMRARGMLETLIGNYRHVAEDVVDYEPSRYHGKVLYFKPSVIPEGVEGSNLTYQEAISTQQAGGYERYIDPDNLEIIRTPHEHDLMMDDASLDIVVPALLRDETGLGIGKDLHRTWTLPATIDGWKQLFDFLMKIPGVPHREANEICLIAEEIMSNIITYAYRDRVPDSGATVRVTADLDGDRFRMIFEDDGKPFNPQADSKRLPSFDPKTQSGGEGRLLISHLSDATSYQYKNGKNIFGFVKKFKRNGTSV